jgi:hypothetical protein
MEKRIQSKTNETMTNKNNDNETDTNIQPPITKPSKWDTNLILHYTHEQRLESVKRDIHHIWHTRFSQTTTTETKLIIGNRNNRNNTKEMVSKRSAKTSYKKQNRQKNT